MVKHATYQKAESLIAASLSKLDNSIKNNSIFNAKCAEFSTKWLKLLKFHNPTWAYNQSPIKNLHYNLHQKSPPKISSTLADSHLPIPVLPVHKTILTIPNNTPILYTSAIFHLHIFEYSYPYNLH